MTDNPTFSGEGWIRGYGPVSDDRVVHTNEDCQYLKIADNQREAEPWELEELDVCSRCAGEIDHSNKTSHHQDALLKAAKEGTA